MEKYEVLLEGPGPSRCCRVVWVVLGVCVWYMALGRGLWPRGGGVGTPGGSTRPLGGGVGTPGGAHRPGVRAGGPEEGMCGLGEGVSCSEKGAHKVLGRELLGCGWPWGDEGFVVSRGEVRGNVLEGKACVSLELGCRWGCL